MIIWRAWGFLAVIIPLVVAALVMSISQAMNDPSDPEQLGNFMDTYFSWLGVGLFLGGIATYVVGIYLNQKRPQQKLAEWRQQRKVELDQSVKAGNFSLGPGHPAPASMAEAEQQAAQLLNHEEAERRRGLFNLSTLFFVPMQWIGVIVGIGGICLALYGFLA